MFVLFLVMQDGQIDYGEFAAMMRKGNGGIGRRTMRNNLNLGEALGLGVLPTTTPTPTETEKSI